MSTVSEDLRRAWQRQALSAPRINLTYLRHRTGALQRRTRIRNACEYVFGLGTVVWVAWSGRDFLSPRPLMSLAAVLWAMGTLWLMAQWHRRASMPEPAEQLGTLDALKFYRQQLERQRDVRRGNWRWWLPPLAPCVVVWFIALFVEVTPTPWFAIAVSAAWVVMAVTLGLVGYERAARGIQHEIDALDSLDAGAGPGRADS
jgi:hypothetical protein